MNKEELFEIIEEDRFCFVESWAKVLRDESGKFYVDSTEWNIVKLYGGASDEEIKWAVEELEDLEVDQEGYYSIKVLFSTSKDYDDYRHWTVLEQEIVQAEYKISIEEHEKQMKELEDLDPSWPFSF